MSDDQDLFQENKKASTLNPNPESDSDAIDSDEIIELTDVVSESKAPIEVETDEPLLLDEEELNTEPAISAEDADTGKMGVTSANSEQMEKVEDTATEDDFSTLESSDFKFESEPAFDNADKEPFPEQSEEQLDDVLAGIEEAGSTFEKPEDILADLEKDDSEEPQVEQAEDFFSGYEESAEDEKPSDFLAGLEAELENENPPDFLAKLEEDQEGEKQSDVLAGLESDEPTELEKDKDDEASGSPPISEEIPGISEEKMKELLTAVIQETVSEVAEAVIRDSVEQTIRQNISEIAEKVINETVDKAIRETVSETAEKVIREAIETLKQSIASSEL